MNNKTLFFFIVTLFQGISCSRGADSNDRNLLVFKDSINNVQDSIIAIKKILVEFPLNKDSVRNYSYRQKILYINGFKIGEIDSIDILNPAFPTSLSLGKKNEFIRLSGYLNKNYIRGCYNSFHSNLWFFVYKNLANVDYDDSRDIVVCESAFDTVGLNDRNKIIDKKGKLLLTAAKNAKID